MREKLTDTFPLSNGRGIPCVGFGTYKITDKKQAVASVRMALQAGYRHIDTAAFYGNEAQVGQAVNESGIPREELFITSKAWKTELGYDRTMAAFEKTMEALGLSYLDLYLVHWPASPAFDENWIATNRDTWRAMTKLYKTGRVKAIGVSNFLVHHLEPLMDMEMIPMVDQIEINPGFLQQETVEYCHRHGIVVEAWSPLGRGRSLAHPLLQQLAEKYQKTPAQIILRWDLQNEILPLPKSVTESRVIENADIFDFALSDEDMAAINSLEAYGNSGHHPDGA